MVMVFLLRLGIVGLTVRRRCIGRFRLDDRHPVIIRARVCSLRIVGRVVVFLRRWRGLIWLGVVGVVVILGPQTIFLRAVVLLVSLTMTKRVVDAFNRVLSTRLDSPMHSFPINSQHTVGCAAS